MKRDYPARQPLYTIGNRATIVFVTVCTKGRKKILAHEDVHELLLESWRQAHHWVVGRYVLMPDHLHLFCAPGIPEYMNVRKWIGYWKSLSTKHWPRIEEKPIWQREAWDRQLRHGDSYSEKWNYVANNSVRHGLVFKPEDWPFQGEMHKLMWHDQ